MQANKAEMPKHCLKKKEHVIQSETCCTAQSHTHKQNCTVADWGHVLNIFSGSLIFFYVYFLKWRIAKTTELYSVLWTKVGVLSSAVTYGICNKLPTNSLVLWVRGCISPGLQYTQEQMQEQVFKIRTHKL